MRKVNNIPLVHDSLPACVDRILEIWTQFIICKEYSPVFLYRVPPLYFDNVYSFTIANGEVPEGNLNFNNMKCMYENN